MRTESISSFYNMTQLCVKGCKHSGYQLISRSTAVGTPLPPADGAVDLKHASHNSSKTIRSPSEVSFTLSNDVGLGASLGILYLYSLGLNNKNLMNISSNTEFSGVTESFID